jgi:hypothetical protein
MEGRPARFVISCSIDSGIAIGDVEPCRPEEKPYTINESFSQFSLLRESTNTYQRKALH